MEFYRLVRIPGYRVLSRGNNLWVTFDARFRVLHACFKGRTFRFGLDGKTVEVVFGDLGGLPGTAAVSSAEREKLLRQIRDFVAEARGARWESFEFEEEAFLRGEEAQAEMHGMDAALDPGNLALVRRRFESIYGKVPILPPDCYGALLVQVTTGCSHGLCSFCSLYGGRAFSIRSPEDFLRHVSEVMEFQSGTLDRFTSVFLGDANALVLPQDRLLADLDALSRVASDLGQERLTQSLYAFTDAGPLDRNKLEWAELARRGLKRVYLGLETGNWSLRSALGKRGDEEAFRRRVAQIKESGIAVGLIVLAGLGDDEEHLSPTAEALCGFPLDEDDYVYVSPLEDPSGTSDGTCARQQAIRMLEALSETLCLSGVKVAVYDIARFVY